MEAVRLESATSSVSSVSFSSVSSLNRFLRRNSEPFSNMAIALGWRVQ
jgi:hypothetical protein